MSILYIIAISFCIPFLTVQITSSLLYKTILEILGVQTIVPLICGECMCFWMLTGMGVWHWEFALIAGVASFIAAELTKIKARF